MRALDWPLYLIMRRRDFIATAAITCAVLRALCVAHLCAATAQLTDSQQHQPQRQPQPETTINDPFRAYIRVQVHSHRLCQLQRQVDSESIRKFQRSRSGDDNDNCDKHL